MFRYIERLRRRPLAERRRVATTVTAIAIIVVALAWISFTLVRLASPEADPTATPKTDSGISGPYGG